ncbi:hypothetical protein A2U01_0030893, partial [Trifolium medium]|nr:hypothetical protein [Trifolium medium]
MDSDNLEFDCE